MGAERETVNKLKALSFNLIPDSIRNVSQFWGAAGSILLLVFFVVGVTGRAYCVWGASSI